MAGVLKEHSRNFVKVFFVPLVLKSQVLYYSICQGTSASPKFFLQAISYCEEFVMEHNITQLLRVLQRINNNDISQVYPRFHQFHNRKVEDRLNGKFQSLIAQQFFPVPGVENHYYFSSAQQAKGRLFLLI